MFTEGYFKECVNEYVRLIGKYSVLLKILLFHAQGSSLASFAYENADEATRTEALRDISFTARRER